MHNFKKHIIGLAIVSILGAMGSQLMFIANQSNSIDILEIIEIEEENKENYEEDLTSFDQDEDSASMRFSDSTLSVAVVETHIQMSVRKNVFWTIDQPPRA